VKVNLVAATMNVAILATVYGCVRADKPGAATTDSSSSASLSIGASVSHRQFTQQEQ
jgi:hypothetical protein